MANPVTTTFPCEPCCNTGPGTCVECLAAITAINAAFLGYKNTFGAVDGCFKAWMNSTFHFALSGGFYEVVFGTQGDYNNPGQKISQRTVGGVLFECFVYKMRAFPQCGTNMSVSFSDLKHGFRNGVANTTACTLQTGLPSGVGTPIASAPWEVACAGGAMTGAHTDQDCANEIFPGSTYGPVSVSATLEL
jgi:hypothetical protein